jgi:hypothetical protein
LLALVLQSAVANHMGDATASAALLAEARRQALDLKNPRLYVDASAHQIVSLTDLGFFAEAEHMGRGLLHWVKEDLQGDWELKQWAEMVASGVLGGQALLHQAVAGGTGAGESLALLRTALEAAHKFQDAREICRDQVQIAGWYALLSPAEAESAFAEAEAVLQKYPWKISGESRSYLLRIRFLGAYRRWLESGSIPEGLERWELPADSVGHLSWLLATSLKYRGALFAAAQEWDRAREDFGNAVRLLDHQSPPVLRLIGATAHLEAALSLQVHDRVLSAAHIQSATRVFEGFAEAAGPALDGGPWLRSCREWVAGGSAQSVRELQGKYPY